MGKFDKLMFDLQNGDTVYIESEIGDAVEYTAEEVRNIIIAEIESCYLLVKKEGR